MTPPLKPLTGAAICAVILFFSCSKPGSLGIPNPRGIDTSGIIIPHFPQKLQPITVEVLFRQPTVAAIKWTASEDLLGDTIRYKILLQGKIVDSNLLTLTDSLKNLLPGITYDGRVIAYTRYNDTVSEPFTLHMLQGFAFCPGINKQMQCVDLFSDQLIWQSTEGGTGTWYTGIPVVVNDTVFANYGMFQTQAFNAKTGQTLWTSPVYLENSNVNASLSNGGPTYYNGNVYAASYAGLICLNSKGGQAIWTHQDGDTYQTTPIADNNKIFVGSFSPTFSLYSAWCFTALDATTGAVVWKKAIGTQPTQYPVIANGLLIFGDASSVVYAVDENTGLVVWTKDFSVYYNNGYIINPLVHYNNIVVVSANGQTYGLNTGSGSIIWQRPFAGGAAVLAPAISHDTLFVTQITGDYLSEQLQLLALRVTTGTVLWQKTESHGYVTSPIVAGGRLYLVGETGMAIYNATDGSYIGTTVRSHLGALQLDGISYYQPESGMVQ
jgi:outer membrane protein assembly factor BamB